MTDNTGKHLTAAYLDQHRKLKEVKLEQENKIDALTKELRESKQEKELLKKEQNQKLQETREALEGQIELLQIELHERKQEMEILKCDTKQLSLAKQEMDKKIEEQSRCIKQTKQNLSCLVYRLANIPLTFTCSDNLSTASALLSFIWKNETPIVFDNFLEFLKQELISDYKVTKDAWSYRKGDRINFIWFVDNFKVRQKQQITNKFTDIKSPRFSIGEKGYFLEVWFDPYGYGESRGTHLSCNLKHNVGPYDDLIIFPHQQQFGVTVINLRDRQNDASVKQTVEVTRKGASFKRTHGILPLTKVENVTINDVLILKISVEHWSA